MYYYILINGKSLAERMFMIKNISIFLCRKIIPNSSILLMQPIKKHGILILIVSVQQLIIFVKKNTKSKNKINNQQ